MPLELGASWLGREPAIPRGDEPRAPSLDELRAEQLLLALASLQEALNSLPAPVVNVAEPDLSAIVQAVSSLNGPASPQEIAQAIRQEIAPAPTPEIEPVLSKLTETLDRLDFRMKGLSAGSGGGGVASRVQNVDGTALSTQDAQLEIRYEWQAGIDTSVPLYIGSAPPGTSTSSASWRIDKYTYIAGPVGDSVPSVVQTATGAWDSRASLF